MLPLTRSDGSLKISFLLVVAGAGLSLVRPQAIYAVSDSWIGLNRGLSSSNRLVNPGKVDVLYKHVQDEERYNVFGWTPLFKGGYGRLDPDQGSSTDYGGGYLRPLATQPTYGDLIMGGLWANSTQRTDWEFQGEYRLPAGLGFGGGLVDVQPGNNITFGKMSYRGKLGRWSYIGEAQWQDVEGEGSPGGYAAVYDSNWMFVGGSDGEQWRTTVGYVAPDTFERIRPSAELLYVDNTMGRLAGPRSFFANVTLRYEGGFLSHPARLGRAMGPQGLEYGNPLGFLIPTWNRRLEVWELGGLADFRAERIRSPRGLITERYEGLLFPGQIHTAPGWIGSLFIGVSYSRSSARETAGILGGWAGRLGFLRTSLGVDHELDPARTSVTVGIVDVF
ncbi:MAG: hypothetical protein JNN07_06015 [Verrucomicrobiales bacterium]|nr:hypothetical protein [Verrucomicrobiales bacterium]